MKLLMITFYKLKMMFADKVFFAAMVIIPLFITLSTGYALRYEKLNTIPIAFVDEDQSNYSRVLIDRLSGKEGLRIERSTREDAVDKIKNNKVEAAFVIGKGFEEKITGGDNKGIIDMVKSPTSSASDYIREVVAGEAMRFVSNHLAVNWVLDKYESLQKSVNDELASEVIRYCDMQWEPKPLMTINYVEMKGDKEVEVKKISMPASTATSAGIIVVFIMFYILFSSGWLIEERRNGTIKRLVSGPDAFGYSFVGNIFALIISGVVQIAFFSLINQWVFHVDLFPGVWSYAVFGAYLLSVISLSMFLSSVLKTAAQLQAGAPVLALLTGFAGGCFWNFVEVSKQIRLLSKLTLQGWALEGINQLLLDPANVRNIILPMLVLFSTSLILLPLSYMMIKVQVKT